MSLKLKNVVLENNKYFKNFIHYVICLRQTLIYMQSNTLGVFGKDPLSFDHEALPRRRPMLYNKSQSYAPLEKKL